MYVHVYIYILALNPSIEMDGALLISVLVGSIARWLPFSMSSRKFDPNFGHTSGRKCDDIFGPRIL